MSARNGERRKTRIKRDEQMIKQGKRDRGTENENETDTIKNRKTGQGTRTRQQDKD